MIPLFIQLTFTKHLPLYSIYLFPHIICFLIFQKFCGLLFPPPLYRYSMFSIILYKILEYFLLINFPKI
jgi:hypothetical protein